MPIYLPPYYRFHNPVRIVAGQRALDALADELEQLDVRRPLLLTDEGVIRTGLLRRVTDALAGSAVAAQAVPATALREPGVEAVNRLAAHYRETRCDAVIAVGGGSVLDAAKGLTVLISEGGDDVAAWAGLDRLSRPPIPWVAVPTTAGTGSEVTAVAILMDTVRRRRLVYQSPRLLPRLALLDPAMTLALPPDLTGSTGMDALAHAVEAYTSAQKNPLSDGYAATAISLLRDFLPQATAHPGDVQARFALANAALLAGIAFSNAMVGAVHALAHACWVVSGTPHRLAVAALLPSVMEHQQGAIGSLYGELLAAIGGGDIHAATPPAQRGARAIAAVRELRARLSRLCSLPMNLRQAGVPAHDLPAIVQAGLSDGCLISNPVELGAADLARLLQAAYDDAG